MKELRIGAVGLGDSGDASSCTEVLEKLRIWGFEELRIRGFG